MAEAMRKDIHQLRQGIDGETLWCFLSEKLSFGAAEKSRKGGALPALLSVKGKEIQLSPVKRELRADFPGKKRHQFVLKRAGTGESILENPI